MGATYLADVDQKGAEMERPYLRLFVEGEDEQEARARAERLIEQDEVVRSVEPLQPVLDEVLAKIAAGGRFAISFKDEADGPSGPVWITDLDAFDREAQPGPGGSLVLGVPFGSQPAHETALPWMTRREALRLARYLGLTLGES